MHMHMRMHMHMYQVDMNAWLITSAYASAAYVGVTCFLLLCVTCTPGGQAASMQKMTCMNLVSYVRWGGGGWPKPQAQPQALAPNL